MWGPRTPYLRSKRREGNETEISFAHHQSAAQAVDTVSSDRRLRPSLIILDTQSPSKKMVFRIARSAVLPCLLVCVLIQVIAISGDNAPKAAADVIAVVPAEEHMINDAPMEDGEDDLDEEKRGMPGVMRFGKRGDMPGVLRFGKRGMPGVMRFGKRGVPGVMRFGKKAMPGVMRFGKRMDDQDEMDMEKN